MDKAFLYLAPEFLTQILLGVLLLWLFVKDRDQAALGKIFATSLIYTALNIVIEWFLNDYLLAATLVLQWALFVLLAQRILAIPLPRASVTLFCYFSLLMGFHMAQLHFTPAELSEEEKLLAEGFEENGEKDAEKNINADWIQRLMAGTLAHKTYSAKNWALDYLYFPDESEEDPVEKIAAPTQTPPVKITPANLAVQNPSPLPEMTGQEFEQLFYPSGSSPAPPGSLPTPVPDMEIPSFTSIENRPPPEQGGISINAQQMSQIVEIKNRSTDPGYSPPNFRISAVGMGAGGHFAIVDGDMLKEGSIIYTQHNQPRGWKLYKVNPHQVFWQPLK